MTDKKKIVRKLLHTVKSSSLTFPLQAVLSDSTDSLVKIP